MAKSAKPPKATKIKASASLFQRLERTVENTGITYLEALARYMVDIGLKPEKIAKMVCPRLRKMLEEDARDKGCLRRKK